MMPETDRKPETAAVVKFIDDAEKTAHECMRRAAALERLMDDEFPEGSQIAADIHAALDQLSEACRDTMYLVAPDKAVSDLVHDIAGVPREEAVSDLPEVSEVSR